MMQSYWLALGLGSLWFVSSCGEDGAGPVTNGGGATTKGGAASAGSSADTGARASHAGSQGAVPEPGGAGSGGTLGDAGQSVGGAEGSVSGGAFADAGASNAGEGGLGGLGGSAAESGSGAGGAGAAAEGGGPGQLPDCNDSKPETQDFFSAIHGCGHITDHAPGGSDGWTYYDAGFYVDQRTGVAWTPLKSAAALEPAIVECDALILGGSVSWRLPTIDEVRGSFAAGCAKTAPNGSCTIHDPSALSTENVYNAECESCLGSATSAYCAPNVPFCTWLQTSSICSDCEPTKNWHYGPGNGNFAAIPVTDSLGVSCVSVGLPGVQP
jgi:hypothetical protein